MTFPDLPLLLFFGLVYAVLLVPKMQNNNSHNLKKRSAVQYVWTGLTLLIDRYTADGSALILQSCCKLHIGSLDNLF